MSAAQRGLHITPAPCVLQEGTPGKVALVLEYDGTAYEGFQFQPGKATVQGELQRALAQLFGAPVKTWGASRTDAGVHAQEQVVAFGAPRPYSLEVLRSALNFYLPEDIKVRAAWEAPETFDPRRHAVSRVYEYAIWNGPYPSPLLRRTAHFVPHPLDHLAMDSAARALEGTHDFSSFTTSTAVRSQSPIRRVLEARVQRSGHLVTLTMEANAFLPHQVRRTAGALVQVGLGRMGPEGFAGLVERPNGRHTGPALPAKGLILKKVYYADLAGPFHDRQTGETRLPKILASTIGTTRSAREQLV